MHECEWSNGFMTIQHIDKSAHFWKWYKIVKKTKINLKTTLKTEPS